MAVDRLKATRHPVLRAGFTTTTQLLAKAARDADPVSVFIDGSSWDDAQAVIFIAKPLEAKAVYEALAQAGLVTPGTPVVR